MGAVYTTGRCVFGVFLPLDRNESFKNAVFPGKPFFLVVNSNFLIGLLVSKYRAEFNQITCLLQFILFVYPLGLLSIQFSVSLFSFLFSF